jgi:hypothetical protein
MKKTGRKLGARLDANGSNGIAGVLRRVGGARLERGAVAVARTSNEDTAHTSSDRECTLSHKQSAPFDLAKLTK